MVGYPNVIINAGGLFDDALAVAQSYKDPKQNKKHY